MGKSGSEIYEELRLRAAAAPLSELLPLLLSLSQILKNRELEKWVRLELNGYYNVNPALTEDVIVPEYRTVAGEHTDEYGRPLLITDPKLSFVNEDRLRNGVSELERLSGRDEMVSIRNPVSAQLLRQY
jgi:hypothetical protein